MTSCRPALLVRALLPLLFICLLATAGWGADTAPGFTLKDSVSGKEYSLSQFKGKVVLLNFFTYFCGPCRQEMPHLNELNQELQGQGFQVVGIGLASTPAQLQTMAKQLGIQYPFLEGNDQVSKAYGSVELVPTTFIIDRQGQIREKILGARDKSGFMKVIKPLL